MLRHQPSLTVPFQFLIHVIIFDNNKFTNFVSPKKVADSMTSTAENVAAFNLKNLFVTSGSRPHG